MKRRSTSAQVRANAEIVGVVSEFILVPLNYRTIRAYNEDVDRVPTCYLVSWRGKIIR
jgi:hypothetical protein